MNEHVGCQAVLFKLSKKNLSTWNLGKIVLKFSVLVSFHDEVQVLDCVLSEDLIAADFCVFVEKCKLGEFSCRNGHCVHKTLKCDGKDDCTDGSDESKCEKCEETPGLHSNRHTSRT